MRVETICQGCGQFSNLKQGFSNLKQGAHVDDGVEPLREDVHVRHCGLRLVLRGREAINNWLPEIGEKASRP